MFTRLQMQPAFPLLQYDKESMCNSGAHTEITNYQNNSFQITFYDQHEDFIEGLYKKQTNTVEEVIQTHGKIDSRQDRGNQDHVLTLKLNQLEEKSSKIISMLPNLHNKIVKTQFLPKFHFQNQFLSVDSGYSNKLKIIRDLQQKIVQLQTNIKDPRVGHEEMRTIQKQINLNFQNYYNQIKSSNKVIEENNNSIISSQQSFDGKDDDKNGSRRQFQTQTSVFGQRISQKIVEQLEVIIYVPKFIEVEIPYQLMKVRQIQEIQDYRHSSQNGSLPLKSSHQVSKHPDSSIQKIINEFNRKCYPQHQNNSQKQDYIYKITQIQPHNQEIQKEEFNLPINSYQRCNSENSEKRQTNLLKKTDRSNISSSNSDIDKIRDDIWTKDYLEFNQEHLSLVKQNEQKSQDNNQDINNDQVVNEQSEIEKYLALRRCEQLETQNQSLKRQLSNIKQELQKSTVLVKQSETKNIELEIQYLQSLEKLQELNELSRQLNITTIHLKQLLFTRQNTERYLNDKICHMERQTDKKMEQKQNSIQEIYKLLNEKSQQFDQLIKINQQIKKVLEDKERSFEQQTSQLESTIQELKQELSYYKNSIEDNGINLKMEEVNYLKDMIQNKEEEDNEKMLEIHHSLEKKYTNTISQLKKEKDITLKQLEQIKGNYHKISTGQIPTQMKNQIEKQLESLMLNYDHEIFRKNQEIIQLKRLSFQYKQLLSEQSNTEQEIRTVNNIKNILIKQNLSNNLVQFIYIIHRLIRSIKLYQYSSIKEKEEKAKLTKKLANLNLYVNKQLETVENSIKKYQLQTKKVKNENNQLQKEVKKLNNKLAVYQCKLSSNDTEPIHHIYQLENQFLSLQNKKLIEKAKKAQVYMQQLEGRYISDLMNTNTGEQINLNKIILKSQEKKQQIQYERILSEIKDSYKKLASFSIKSSKDNIKIYSKVIQYGNKQLRMAKTPQMKALLAPLPSIVASIITNNHNHNHNLPEIITSITLDKIMKKKIFYCPSFKKKVALKLIDLGLQLVKVSKKLFSLKPCQILVNNPEGEVQIILRRQYGNATQQDEESLIYRAPQVLLGFTESQASYVWSIGLMIDQIYHQSIFYRKLNEVLSHKNNYRIRNDELIVKDILISMLKKNHKQRPTLAGVKQLLIQIL